LQVQVLSPLLVADKRKVVSARMATETPTGGTSTDERESPPAPQTEAGGRGARRRTGRGSLLSRIRRYVREVVGELRKVIYPSRNELVTYVIVVLVFVTFMTALVSGLDYGLTKAVLALFG